MKTFRIAGGERQVRVFRKEIKKALDVDRTLVLKFFQLKTSLLYTEIERKLEDNEPINLGLDTHFGVSSGLTPTDLIVNVCWGWEKISYSQLSSPDLVLYIYPDGLWEFHCGTATFEKLSDWQTVSDLLWQVYHSIIFDILKLDNIE